MSPIHTPNHERTTLRLFRIRHLALCLPLFAMGLSSVACDVEDVEHGSAEDEVDSEDGDSGFEESEDGGSGAEETGVSDEPCEGMECAPVRDLELDLTAEPDPAANTACGGVVGLNHGYNLFEQSYQATMGCACTPGSNRDYFSVYNVGNGSCSAIGWESPDPRDCRVRMQINASGGFANGTCNLVVEQSPAGSCYLSQTNTGCNNSLVTSCVCSHDSYCCNNQWDALCAWEVTALGCG
jgi:hypothetical protein